MIIQQDMDLMKKLTILSDAAKYDAACTSSGVDKKNNGAGLGNAKACGICHSFSVDGRCISLLKILFTNECIYNCRYCVNRSSNDVLRATFTPEEVCRLTIEFYRRNYIEGLFLSSGIIVSPDETMKRLTETVMLLRTKYHFGGYIHLKGIPGASQSLIETAGLLSGRKDVVVVSSVSCIYGMGNPSDFYKNVIEIERGRMMDRNVFLRRLVDSLYVRNDIDLNRGNFRVKGDTVDIYLAYTDNLLRVTFWGDEIDGVEEVDPITGVTIAPFDAYKIYPANLFMTTKEATLRAIHEIEDDLTKQVAFFESIGKEYEAKRLYERVTYDMEMIRELGHCSGIENYSRYFDGRAAGTRPYCLLDFFPDDFLIVIDESHVSVPQIRAMYGGDRARKINLVEYGFRLPAAMDNRPLKFEEFQEMAKQVIYVSATPADYELIQSEGIVVEQVIRPTGLLDPVIEVRPSLNQIDDLMEEIQLRIEKEERVLVTTLTKRMAEELAEYLLNNNVRCNYIHSDVDTLERVKIMDDLRQGIYDVLIGVNLLREGLDLPEVSLVAILDADKEGFLRSHRSLTQTAGRAARNVNGKVIMYADRMTDSMKLTIDETNRRREKQLAYNEANGITPQQIKKARNLSVFGNAKEADELLKERHAYVEPSTPNIAADPVVQYMSKAQMEKSIERTRKLMQEAAKKLEFIEAAQYRDELLKLEDLMKEKWG